MTAALLAGALAGYGIAMPVGAVTVLIVGLTARTSLRVGVAAGLGVATADGVYATVAVAGGVALSGLIRPVSGPLRVVAVAVLVAIAVRTAVTALRRRNGSAIDGDGRLGTPRGAYLGLLGITLLNPATIVYFGALVVGGQAGGATGGSVAARAGFVAAAFASSASWQLLMVCGGSLLGRVLTGPRGRLATALASSALIVLLAGYLLLG